MDINKSDRNTPIEFNVDSAYKVRVQLEFQKVVNIVMLIHYLMLVI